MTIDQPEIRVQATHEENPGLNLVDVAASETKPQKCGHSPEYMRIIRKAGRNIFEPESLGDVDDLARKYNCQIKSPEDAIKYADEALKVAGDRYTDLHPRDEAARLKKMEDGELVGIGVDTAIPPGSAEKYKGARFLGRVHENSPAHKAGIRAGDTITHVDGVDLTDKTLRESNLLIAGEEGNPVELTVLRKDGTSENIEVIRGPFEMKAVDDKRLENNIALIKIHTFGQPDTAEEVKEALERHKDASGFIFDLRGNGGGSMQQALQVASLIMDEGKLVSVKERTPSDWDEPGYDLTTYNLTDKEIEVNRTDAVFTGLHKFAKGLERYPDMVHVPIAVLTDEGTASAAEILAAALKENGEAEIVGENTYGKGIGQMVFKNMPEDSWLRVTNFRYFTPNGNWLGDGQNTKIGIKPDHYSPMSWNVVHGSARGYTATSGDIIFKTQT